MEVENLVPGMQDRRESHLGLQTLIVPGKLLESAGDALKEEIEDEFRVVPGQRVEFVGQGDHQVEVVDGQEPFQARCQPLGLLEALALGTVAITAGVVGDGQVAAALAARVHVSS